MEEDKEPEPFNVILDMFTPFTTVEELLFTDLDFQDLIKTYIKCAYNTYVSKDEAIEITELNKFNKINDQE